MLADCTYTAGDVVAEVYCMAGRGFINSSCAVRMYVCMYCLYCMAGRGFINVESLADLMKLLDLVSVPE